VTWPPGSAAVGQPTTAGERRPSGLNFQKQIMLSLATQTANAANGVSDDGSAPAKPPAPWRDDACTPLVVTVPAGRFIMGESHGDKFADDTERPAHPVTITGFALGKFPVTSGEFQQFRGTHLPGDDSQLPAIQVNWHDAVAYCQWLTEKTGRAYRLPTEAEWEFACRAGSSTPFSTGDLITTSAANFLYDEAGIRVGPGRRSRAGTYSPNRFGLCDLHGNVCEWVADTWHPNYAGAPANNGCRMGNDNRRV